MEETPNPKCNRCKCYWKPDETDIKSSGLQYKTCKNCRENCKKYGEENVDKIKEYQKKYREENADNIKEQKKKYYEENADKIKEQRKQYREENKCEHNREKSYCRDCKGSSYCIHDKLKSICRDCGGSQICPHDKQKKGCKECNLPLYLINLQRGAIKRCFKSSNLEKTKPSIEYLGCSPEYFIEHFKKKMDNFNQFSEIEMTWDNIHIDHIKPVNSFNLDDEEEFLSCCNYSNLQPLLAEVNLSKNCKWSDEDEAYWNEKIKDKEYYDIYIPV